VKLGTEKRIPIYLNKYRYICITNYNLRQIDKKIKRREDFELKTIEESENATVQDLLSKIAAVEEN
jgi:thioredoxin-related protein